MAEQFGRTGSNILRNPFAQARNDGPQFDDQGKRAPINQQQQTRQDSSITDLNHPEGFIPPEGNENINDNTNKNKKKTGEGDDPMLQFDTLWDDAPIDKDNPPKEFKGYLPEIDDKAFGDRVNQMDFSKSIKPEVMAAIMKGGEEAAGAWPELINSIGRSTFRMAFNASSKMTKASLDNVEKRFMDDLIPNSIQSRMVDDSLVEGNELAANPKYAPMYKSVRAQYAKKFPKATPTQISDATKAYMGNFVKDATKKDIVVDDNTKLLQKGSGDANWSEWLDT